MRTIFTLAAMLLAFSGFAQFDYSTSSRWSDNPKLHPLNPQFDSSAAVGILDSRRIEYVVEKDEAFVLATYHKIVRINNDRGIEMFNKIYIPMGYGSQIKDIKARTIQKNGKVVPVPHTKIKEIEEDGRMYKLFAMEGVEKGSEVEYIYTVRRNMTVFGSEVLQNSRLPYEEVQFALIVPEHLKFDVKGYNGFVVSPDSVIEKKRIIVGRATNVEQLEDEKYAMLNGHLKRVQFKLSYNLANSSSTRLYTWREFAKRLFTIYTTYNSKEEKALDKLAGQISLSGARSEAEKILLIEDYIKTNFNIDQKIIGDDAEALDKVVKTRNTNRDGSVRMFAYLFDKFGISYQIVFAGDRSEFPIDEELENWNSVEEIVFHFPKTGKYMAPMSSELRYPYIPDELAGTTGLFLKTTTIGSFRTAMPSFNVVEMEPYDAHAINMEARVRFDKDLEALLISSQQILKGYGAASYRPIYAFLPKERQDEINKDIIKSVANTTDITNIKIHNPALKDYFDNKPLIIQGELKSTALIERAGNKILFKIGEIIGQQAEMYQEKPRKLPVELDYPHVLERKIVFEIPEGYVVKNLNDLVFDLVYRNKENEVTLAFISKYTVEGNILTVQVEEIYRELHYPLEQFDNFKKVINAAADFNKVVLVLEKK